MSDNPIGMPVEPEPGWMREQFDNDPLLQTLEPEPGIAPEPSVAEAEDPFATFAFESRSIAVERQNTQLAPWLMLPPPDDGYFRALTLSDLEVGKGMGLQLYNRKIAIFRPEPDKVMACDDVCPHAGAPLSNGLLHGCALMCVWHGWTFDLETGESDVNENMPLHLYPVQIRDGEVWVGVLVNPDND